MLTRVLARLDRHWFAPAPIRDLATVRIVMAAAMLLFFLPDLGRISRLAEGDPSTFRPLPVLKVLMLPFGGWGVRPEPMFLKAVWVLTVIAAVGVLVGAYTRLSLFALAASFTLLTAHNYSYGEVHHPETIFIIALWLLACSQAGDALSLDGLRRRIDRSLGAGRFEPVRPEAELSEYARWPLRVTQWLLVLAYLSAGISKLSHGGLQWFNGYTLTYYFIQDGVRFGSRLGLTLAQYPALASLLAVGSVLFELTFALAILVPRLAWPYMLMGTAFHTGIFVLQRAPFFPFVVLYVVFIESLRNTWPPALRRPKPAPWTVIYDGLCSLCIRSMVILDYLDFRQRLRVVDFEGDWAAVAAVAPGLSPDRARAALHLVAPDGRVYSGFAAFRALARLLPVLWPLLPIVYAPLSGVIGPRLYRLVASNRGRLVCRGDACVA